MRPTLLPRPLRPLAPVRLGFPPSVPRAVLSSVCPERVKGNEFPEPGSRELNEGTDQQRAARVTPLGDAAKRPNALRFKH